MKPYPQPPVIIIGMHRSGTSMISNMLEDMGLYSGWKKDIHNEAIFFQQLNTWIMKSANAYWDNPCYTRYIIDHPVLRQTTVNFLKGALKGTRRLSYLGLGNFLSTSSITELNVPWCWKDPRSTFTLPIWLEIFPNAKILHIKRHGLDVANSLKKRAQIDLDTIPHKPYKSIYNFLLKRSGFCHSAACLNLISGVSLWDEYVSEANKHVAELGNQALELKYEDFLTEPAITLNKIGKFCNLNFSETTLQALTKKANPQRAYAYRKNNQINDVVHDPIVKSLLEKHGY